MSFFQKLPRSRLVGLSVGLVVLVCAVLMCVCVCVALVCVGIAAARTGE